jgi:hypothetical protein
MVNEAYYDGDVAYCHPVFGSSSIEFSYSYHSPPSTQRVVLGSRTGSTTTLREQSPTMN